MKKLVFLGVAALAIAFTSCGKKEQPAQQAPAAVEQPAAPAVSAAFIELKNAIDALNTAIASAEGTEAIAAATVQIQTIKAAIEEKSNALNETELAQVKEAFNAAIDALKAKNQ